MLINEIEDINSLILLLLKYLEISYDLLEIS
jgi:hypothetical protein